MPRKPRVHFDGAVYHVMARGIDGRDLFSEHREQSLFYDCVRRTKRARPFDLLGHCLMSNHFHLIIRVLSAQLAQIMQLIQTRFAVIYNKNHERAGHVFQGRYLPLLIPDDVYLMTVLRYVHLNPVAAGLVALPEQWRLSGHNELIGAAKPDLVDAALPLSLFDDDPGAARKRYLEFVYAKLSDPDRELPPYDTSAVVEPETTELADDPPPTLEALAALEAEASGIELEWLYGGRRGLVSDARKRLIVTAFMTGHRLSAIAKHLGLSPAYVSRVAWDGAKSIS